MKVYRLSARTADPASRFHSDFLAYRKGEITRAEWIARLPHIAMVGDSVCMGFHVSSRWGTFLRARCCRDSNWFFDRNPQGIDSVSRRLEQFTPLVAMELAGVGAMVDDEHEGPSFFRKILGTRNLSGQVTQLASAARFPDLILVSIGHNNADWAWGCPPGERHQPERFLQREAARFGENFTRQLRRLIVLAERQRHRVAIVVYGLVDFERYFKGRELAERRRTSDLRSYPHLETTYRYFQSFQPAYRRYLIELAAMINEQLRVAAGALRNECDPNHLQLRYSDALAMADLSRVELLHPVDAWHPSVAGHNVLAEAAFKGLQPSLEFLGITSRVPQL